MYVKVVTENRAILFTAGGHLEYGSTRAEIGVPIDWLDRLGLSGLGVVLIHQPGHPAQPEPETGIELTFRWAYWFSDDADGWELVVTPAFMYIMSDDGKTIDRV